ncbi:MAG TPA: Ig-like domain-containing protein [Bdellovibrionota bacterium]|nr:Ig-like domain-containing protein [Bdellovibrionota bacterium]
MKGSALVSPQGLWYVGCRGNQWLGVFLSLAPLTLGGCFNAELQFTSLEASRITFPFSLALMAASSQVAGTCIPVTVEFQDDTTPGNPPAADVVVNLSNTGTGQYFMDAGCVVGANGTTILAGTTSSDVYYRGTLAHVEVLTASASGVNAGTWLLAIDPGPPDPTHSTIAGNPSAGLKPDGVDATSVKITVRDAYGNAVPGVSVTFDSTGSGNAVTQPAAVTDTSGLAAGSMTSTVAETKTIYLVTPSNLAFVTGTVIFGGVSPSLSTIGVSPATITADGSATALVTVTLKDTGGAPVAGKAVSLSTVGGALNVTPGAASTDAGGQISFTVSTTTAAMITIGATDDSDGIQLDSTTVLTTMAGPTSGSLSDAAPFPAAVVADGGTKITVSVSLVDVNGNPEVGHTVSLVSDRGGADVINPATAISDSSGVAQFTIKSTLAGQATLTATDTTANVPIQSQPIVTFVPGPVSLTQSAVFASPMSLPADGSPSTITVVLRDANFNPIPGEDVSLSSSRGGTDSIDAPSGQSTATGQVTFAVHSSTAGSAVFSAKDVTEGNTLLTPTATVTFTAFAGLTISDGPTYDYGTWGSGKTPSHTFHITNTGSQPATVTSVSVPGGVFFFSDAVFPGFGGTCGSTIAAGATCTMVLTYYPMTPEIDAATVVINYDNPGSHTVSRDLVGTAVNTAILAVTDYPPNYYTGFGLPPDPATFDFGSVGVAMHIDKTFYVTNNGPVDANGVSPQMLGGSFTYEGGLGYPGPTSTCGGTIVAGATCTVVLRFTPASAATFNSDLVINYDDGSGSTSVDRLMTGKGVNSAVLTVYDFSDRGNGANIGAAFDFGPIGTTQSAGHDFLVINSGPVMATGLGPYGGMPVGFGYKGSGYPGGSGTSNELGGVPYCGSTLAAGTQCAIGIAFSPSSASAFSGSIGLAYSGGPNAVRGVQGTGTSFALLTLDTFNSGGPTTVTDFGYASLGNHLQKLFVVKNVGAQTAMGLSPEGMSAEWTFIGGGYPGGGAPFQGVSFCGTQLNAGDRCLLGMDFQALSTGDFTQTFKLDYFDGSGSVTVSRGMKAAGTNLAILTLDTCDQGCNGNNGGGLQTYYLGLQPTGPTQDAYFFLKNTGSQSANIFDSGTSNTQFHFGGGTFPGGSGPVVVYSNSYSYCTGSISPGQTCVIRMSFSSGSAGHFAGMLSLSATGAIQDSLQYALEATATNQAIVDLLDSPTQAPGQNQPYDYGTFGINTDHIFILKNRGNSTAGLTDGATLGGTFTYTTGSYPGGSGSVNVYGSSYSYCGGSLGTGQSCALSVRFNSPGVSGGPYSGAVTINLTSAATLTTTRALTALSTDRGLLYLSEHSTFGDCLDNCGPYDFGTILANNTITRFLVVTNVGNAAVTSIAQSGSFVGPYQWNLGSFPGNPSGGTVEGNVYPACAAPILPGVSCVISVDFHPVGIGSFSDQITLSSSDAFGPLGLTRRNITGTGN